MKEINIMHMLASIGNMIHGLSAGTPLGKILIAAGVAASAFYSPIVLLLVSCFAFTVTDMVYGIKVACAKLKKIESHKNWKGTIVKLIDEFVIITLARLLEISVFGAEEVSVLTGGATTIVALTELWSIIENLNTLNPDGPWKTLGKFLKKKGEDYIGTEIELGDVNTNDDKLASNES